MWCDYKKNAMLHSYALSAAALGFVRRIADVIALTHPAPTVWLCSMAASPIMFEPRLPTPSTWHSSSQTRREPTTQSTATESKPDLRAGCRGDLRLPEHPQQRRLRIEFVAYAPAHWAVVVRPAARQATQAPTDPSCPPQPPPGLPRSIQE